MKVWYNKFQMKFNRYETPENPPEFLAYLLGSALKSGETEDRLLALSAANNHDRHNDTEYGRIVLMKFMRAAGEELVIQDVSDRRQNVVSSNVSACDLDTVRVLREVSAALDPATGPKLKIAEVVSKYADIVLVTGSSPDSEMKIHKVDEENVLPSGELAIPLVSEEAPYLVEQEGTRAMLDNLYTASKCVTSPNI